MAARRTRIRAVWLGAAAVGLFTALACERGPAESGAADAPAAAEGLNDPAEAPRLPSACALTRPKAIEPVGDGQSGGVILVDADGRRLAIVADEDEHALHTVDATTLEELS